MTRFQDGTTDRSTEPREDLKSLRQASEKARDPEVVARIVDPKAFMDAAEFVVWRYGRTAHDLEVHGARIQREWRKEALAKARAIIALIPDTLPLIEALEKIISAPNVRTLRDAVFIAKTALTQIKEALHG